MLKISVKNKYNQTLQITQNNKYAVVEVTGLTPPKANINTSNLATKDGSVFNSSKLQNRNIVIDIVPTGDCEAARLDLYKYFRGKQICTLYIETSTRKVMIDGYVESVTANLYENPQKVQMSIICPDPWFKSETPQVINFDTNPKTINSDSDDDTGVIITATMSGAASDPSFTNSTTGETFSLDYDFQSGDVLTVDTRRGSKSVKVLRSGATINLLNYITSATKWIYLITGNNTITYNAASGAANMAVKLTLQSIFEGV